MRAEAQAEGLVLNSEHWEVVRFLRSYFSRKGVQAAVRDMVKHFRKVWGPERGNSKYLHQLFPRGARATAWRGSFAPRESTETLFLTTTLLAAAAQQRGAAAQPVYVRLCWRKRSSKRKDTLHRRQVAAKAVLADVDQRTKPPTVKKYEAVLLQTGGPMKKVVLSLTVFVCASTLGVALAGEKSGADVYNSACMACHSIGAAGAPIVGDKENWNTRAEQGFEALVSNATNGKKAMPPKGGNPSLSDEDVKKAVEYMLAQTGVPAK